MKAAFYYGPGDIRIQEVPRPTVKKNGVIIRVRACGVCNMMDLDLMVRPRKGPLGIGHEWSGEVVEVGSNVTFCKAGDRFFGYAFQPCYRCEACLVGDYWRCINWKEAVIDMQAPGAFAEYYEVPFILPENSIILPKTLSFRDLALIEPLSLSSGIAKKQGEANYG